MLSAEAQWGAQGIISYMIIYTYTTHNTHVISHTEKRPATGSIHLCAVPCHGSGFPSLPAVGMSGWPFFGLGTL